MPSPIVIEMDGETPTPAAHAVFQTAELLEKILLSLPLTDLLLAQKICKFFKASIEGSSKAQTALFYRAAGSDLLRFEKTGLYSIDEAEGFWSHVKSSRKSKPVINPLMRRFIITQWMKMNSIVHIGFVSPVFDRSAYINPYLAVDEEVQDEDGGDADSDIGPRNIDELEALHRKGASWRQMLFMQPACEMLNARCDITRKSFTISNPNGVTLQNLVDGLRSHWFECPTCPVNFNIQRWDYQGYQRGEIVLDELDPINDAWSLLHELETK
ncbi:hypothetical protein M409DRAFT_54318 [Zasmidium cellare ATCC 36951]|uniref:F-box domain-containing protein n=1 Tax=Zasmidium cellare ATCC 36951 TaxID=1080233 RepID=A0A6A6CIZ0_ZASCE|nr:uncharacterized protein M409DRAFT_54318 [Zasmidium cellare ATCC 36951]KAF2167115.1 hypothetical protein M409DRAFT_54318 [Zasmidium cellare ATCC 36951]